MQSMENSDNSTSKITQPVKKVVTKKVPGLVKKIDAETAKILFHFREKVNKKDFGRKVTDIEILAKAVRLLAPEHIQELQEATFSQQDRLKMAYEDYVKTNGKATFDQFLGRILEDLSQKTKNS